MAPKKSAIKEMNKTSPISNATKQGNQSPPSKNGNKSTVTRIVIKYDAGFPNTLFLRGSGANLSWNVGIKLKNINSNEWIWETSTPFSSCEFKVLVNDQYYETGDNHTISYGNSIEYTPSF